MQAQADEVEPKEEGISYLLNPTNYPSLTNTYYKMKVVDVNEKSPLHYLQ